MDIIWNGFQIGDVCTMYLTEDSGYVYVSLGNNPTTNRSDKILIC